MYRKFFSSPLSQLSNVFLVAHLHYCVHFIFLQYLHALCIAATRNIFMANLTPHCQLFWH